MTELNAEQKRNLNLMVIQDALSEVAFTYSVNTKLALKGTITAEERRKRQDEAFYNAFDSLVKLLDAETTEQQV